MEFITTLLSGVNIYVFAAVIAVIAALTYFLPVIVFKLYNSASSELTIAALKEVIYQLDKMADELENSEKREEAIKKLGDLISIKGITIPKVMRGWIVDAQVQHIRALQKESAKETDLHKDE